MTSQLLLDLDETTTEDWGFNALGSHGAPRLVEPYTELPRRPICLFALANKCQLFVAAGSQGVTVGSLEELRKATAENNSVAATTIAFSEEVLYLVFTSDEKHLVIVSTTGSLYVFLVEAFKNGPSPEPIISIPVGDIKDIKANPYIGKELAILSQDGGLIIYNIETQSSNSVVSAGAKSFAWSPKGKQLVVGKNDGTLQQYTPTGDARASIPRPEELEQGHFALNITWLETHLFVVVYSAPQTPEEHDFTSYIVKREKADNIIKFLKIFDPCPPYGDESRFGSFYVDVLKNWQEDIPYLILMSAAPSADISIFTTEESFSLLDDNTRASLPMSEDDTSPVGMAIDFSSSEPVSEPCKGVDECAPLPILWVLNNEGNICAWHIVSQQGIKKGTASLKKVYEPYLKNIEIAASSEPISESAPPVSTNSVSSANTASPFSSIQSDPSSGKQTGFGFSLDSAVPVSTNNFGSSTTATTPFFGSSGFGTSASTSTPSFGSSGFASSASTAAPVFDSSASKAAPAFGSSGFGASASKATPAFGSSGFGSSTPANIPTFGASSFGSTAVPTFGASGFGSFGSSAAPDSGTFTSDSSDSTAVPVFGSSNFGSSTDSPFATMNKSSSESPFSSLNKPAETVKPLNASVGESPFGVLNNKSIESPFAKFNKPSETGETENPFGASSGSSPFASFNKTTESPFANLGTASEAIENGQSKISNANAFSSTVTPLSKSSGISPFASFNKNSGSPFASLNAPENKSTSPSIFGSTNSSDSAFGSKFDISKTPFSSANAGFSLGTLIEPTANEGAKTYETVQTEALATSVFNMGKFSSLDNLKTAGAEINGDVKNKEPGVENPSEHKDHKADVEELETNAKEPIAEVESPQADEEPEADVEESEADVEESEADVEEPEADVEEPKVGVEEPEVDIEVPEADVEKSIAEVEVEKSDKTHAKNFEDESKVKTEFDEAVETPVKIIKQQKVTYAEPEVRYEIEEIIRPSEPKIIKQVEVKYAEPVVKYDIVKKIVIPPAAEMPAFSDLDSNYGETPALSKDSIENEYSTLYEDIEAEFGVLAKNVKLLAEFIHDHKNVYHTSEPMETNDFTTLRLSESHYIGDIFQRMQNEVSKSLENYKNCDSNIEQLKTTVEELEFKLPRILEIIKARTDDDNAHRMRYRSLSFEDAAMQKKLRNNLKALDQMVHKAESEILVLKSKIYRVNQSPFSSSTNTSGPSLEGIEASIQKISRMARRRANEVHGLAALVQELRVGSGNNSQLSIGSANNNTTLNNGDVSFSLSINTSNNNYNTSRMSALAEVDLISMGAKRAFKARVSELFRSRDSASVTNSFTL
ncbi:hypothetical protein NADFUDRAFT_52374 [Nadsonia fulvescens var. elongata DSM 6958]|uniref:Nucleoporin Nup159/Nup146 N-terminal domain-containing protein n=1 Tax=Nadsonia fulvescens var. elongata DSM 6958 TaxID=857566 RepID=A0A1E3PHG9_9ASCO|nr:hypothetical protein NADFUDRAFT_52374 [Nadsonia fulvescens var. elongata DSM 6958]